jgi:hypothetical protein
MLRPGARLLTGWALLSGLSLAAAAANHGPFSGTWAMDTSKSQVVDGRNVTLTINFTGDVLKLTVATKKADSTATYQFSCDTASGADCVFDESGHKSKVTVYFNGAVLNVFKTDGAQGEVVTQWKLDVSPDGKSLTDTVSYIEPAAKDEVLVFGKGT